MRPQMRLVFHLDELGGNSYFVCVTADATFEDELHSEFTARGTVTKIGNDGHDIALDVDMPNARIEDMLQLAVKTEPEKPNH